MVSTGVSVSPWSTMASTYDLATWSARSAGGSVEGADGLAPRVLSAVGPVLRQEPEADAAWLFFWEGRKGRSLAVCVGY